jgi:hypothetical protein
MSLAHQDDKNGELKKETHSCSKKGAEKSEGRTEEKIYVRINEREASKDKAARYD